MTTATLNCIDERRRHEVRRQGMNGLDYLEVSDDQRRLTVYFLGSAPEEITPENVRITGGERIRDIRVTDIEVHPQSDPEQDSCMVVTVDKPGDFSTYTLCLIDLPHDASFDPRYRCVDFNFKAACRTELDCKSSPLCPPEPRREPEINYLAKDYASFRRLILDRLSVVMPNWRERLVPDLGITLVELLAYTGDYLSYYQDAVSTEAYLDTARQRISVRRHARLVDYRMHEGCNARAWVHVHTSKDETLPLEQLSFLTRFPEMPEVEERLLRWDDLRSVPPHQFEVYEPVLVGGAERLVFYKEHNEIHFYTWGDAECCLPQGATTATLVDSPAPSMDDEIEEPGADEEASDEGEGGGDDETPPEETDSRVLDLEPGDVLIFEEIVGPKTGTKEDADPTHRHAVRLTHVEKVTDELYGQPLLEIAWAEEDALPFPLCISTIGPAPDCRFIEGVSVARGNIVLVDHGRRIDGSENLGCVPVEDQETNCKGEGRPADVVRRAGRFRPTLAQGPLTFSQAITSDAPASRQIDQNPREALPWIRLDSRSDPDCGGEANADTSPHPWAARPDLLASGAGDDHYVVEMDGRRRAHLRFGDGELGRQPEVGHRFEARYRVGNGPDGNVGAETIRLAVTRDAFSGFTLQARNPLPARGGTAPEPVAEVKLFAPHAFRHVRERAITAADYAELAGRHPKVQRAAAELRWNGSWYEARVAIDPYGQTGADPELLEELRAYLYRFRRIGHDLAVRPAHYVALDIVFDVCVNPGFLRGHVKAALLERFSDRCLPDGSLGFFHPDNLSFGEDISLSRLVAAAQRVAGVDSVTVTKLERLFEGPNGEIEAGVLPIAALEIARLDSDPNFPENGRIRFDMRGGR